MASLVSTTVQPEPRLRRWTREEYHRMVELGLFHDQRVELIDGEILEMSPQEALHFATISKLQKVLSDCFGDGYWVRAQGPFIVGDHSEPEPDIAVVAGNIDDYAEHPKQALLVVEVSYSTLAFDRRDKASMYAAAGVADYWIVNLVDRQLEVLACPSKTHRSGSVIASAIVKLIGSADFISPLALPHKQIRIAVFPAHDVDCECRLSLVVFSL